MNDKFVIEVLDNAVFGGPVFRTIGGATRCPHEPNTTPREAGVEAYEIVPVCTGSTVEHRACQNLPDGQNAYFALRLRVDYVNCYLKGDDGKCVQGFPDDTFEFDIQLGEPMTQSLCLSPLASRFSPHTPSIPLACAPLLSQ
jgi:hypothetical protein